MNSLVKQKLKSWIFNFKQRNLFKCRFGKMYSHLENISIEELIKNLALIKLNKLLVNLKNLIALPLNSKVKRLGWIWLQSCWEKLLRNVGFTSIHELFQELKIMGMPTGDQEVKKAT